MIRDLKHKQNVIWRWKLRLYISTDREKQIGEKMGLEACWSGD